MVADQMAKYVNNGTQGLLLFADPPNLVQGILHEDKNVSTRIVNLM